MAPLKLRIAQEGHAGAAAFPSPKGGGPIEAGLTANTQYFVRVAFPSPKGGGPIEATGGTTRSEVSLSPFHRRKAVAPLKHCLPRILDDLLRSFHRRKAVAPLKQH